MLPPAIGASREEARREEAPADFAPEAEGEAAPKPRRRTARRKPTDDAAGETLESVG